MPDRKIYARLGHNRHLTDISKEQQKKFEAAITKGVSLCNLRAVWRRFEISSWTAEGVEFGEGNIFVSASLAELLKRS